MQTQSEELILKFSRHTAQFQSKMTCFYLRNSLSVEVEHRVDCYESERVFEHANIFFTLTANDYKWNRWEVQDILKTDFPLYPFLLKHLWNKLSVTTNLAIFNFYNLLFRMMETLKMLAKHSLEILEYRVSLYQGMTGERSSFYTFKDFCAICWQYYILIINCSSKEKMKNRDAKFKVIQIAKMNNAWLLY